MFYRHPSAARAAELCAPEVRARRDSNPNLLLAKLFPVVQHRNMNLSC